MREVFEEAAFMEFHDKAFSTGLLTKIEVDADDLLNITMCDGQTVGLETKQEAICFLEGILIGWELTIWRLIQPKNESLLEK